MEADEASTLQRAGSRIPKRSKSKGKSGPRRDPASMPLSKLPSPSLASILSPQTSQETSASNTGRQYSGMAEMEQGSSSGVRWDNLGGLQERSSAPSVQQRASKSPFGLPLASSDSLTSFEDFDPTAFFKPQQLQQQAQQQQGEGGKDDEEVEQHLGHHTAQRAEQAEHSVGEGEGTDSEQSGSEEDAQQAQHTPEGRKVMRGLSGLLAMTDKSFTSMSSLGGSLGGLRMSPPDKMHLPRGEWAAGQGAEEDLSGLREGSRQSSIWEGLQGLREGTWGSGTQGGGPAELPHSRGSFAGHGAWGDDSGIDVGSSEGSVHGDDLERSREEAGGGEEGVRELLGEKDPDMGVEGDPDMGAGERERGRGPRRDEEESGYNDVGQEEVVGQEEGGGQGEAGRVEVSFVGGQIQSSGPEQALIFDGGQEEGGEQKEAGRVERGSHDGSFSSYSSEQEEAAEEVAGMMAESCHDRSYGSEHTEGGAGKGGGIEHVLSPGGEQVEGCVQEDLGRPARNDGSYRAMGSNEGSSIEEEEGGAATGGGGEQVLPCSGMQVEGVEGSRDSSCFSWDSMTDALPPLGSMASLEVHDAHDVNGKGDSGQHSVHSMLEGGRAGSETHSERGAGHHEGLIRPGGDSNMEEVIETGDEGQEVLETEDKRQGVVEAEDEREEAGGEGATAEDAGVVQQSEVPKASEEGMVGQQQLGEGRGGEDDMGIEGHSDEERVLGSQASSEEGMEGRDAEGVVNSQALIAQDEKKGEEEQQQESLASYNAEEAMFRPPPQQGSEIEASDVAEEVEEEIAVPDADERFSSADSSSGGSFAAFVSATFQGGLAKGGTGKMSGRGSGGREAGMELDGGTTVMERAQSDVGGLEVDAGLGAKEGAQSDVGGLEGDAGLGAKEGAQSDVGGVGEDPLTEAKEGPQSDVGGAEGDAGIGAKEGGQSDVGEVAAQGAEGRGVEESDGAAVGAAEEGGHGGCEFEEVDAENDETREAGAADVGADVKADVADLGAGVGYYLDEGRGVREESEAGDEAPGFHAREDDVCQGGDGVGCMGGDNKVGTAAAGPDAFREGSVSRCSTSHGTGSKAGSLSSYGFAPQGGGGNDSGSSASIGSVCSSSVSSSMHRRGSWGGVRGTQQGGVEGVGEGHGWKEAQGESLQQQQQQLQQEQQESGRGRDRAGGHANSLSFSQLEEEIAHIEAAFCSSDSAGRPHDGGPGGPRARSTCHTPRQVSSPSSSNAGNLRPAAVAAAANKARSAPGSASRPKGGPPAARASPTMVELLEEHLAEKRQEQQEEEERRERDQLLRGHPSGSSGSQHETRQMSSGQSERSPAGEQQRLLAKRSLSGQLQSAQQGAAAGALPGTTTTITPRASAAPLPPLPPASSVSSASAGSGVGRGGGGGGGASGGRYSGGRVSSGSSSSSRASSAQLRGENTGSASARLSQQQQVQQQHQQQQHQHQQQQEQEEPDQVELLAEIEQAHSRLRGLMPGGASRDAAADEGDEGNPVPLEAIPSSSSTPSPAAAAAAAAPAVASEPHTAAAPLPPAMNVDVKGERDGDVSLPAFVERILAGDSGREGGERARHSSRSSTSKRSDSEVRYAGEQDTVQQDSHREGSWLSPASQASSIHPSQIIGKQLTSAEEHPASNEHPPESSNEHIASKHSGRSSSSSRVSARAAAHSGTGQNGRGSVRDSLQGRSSQNDSLHGKESLQSRHSQQGSNSQIGVEHRLDGQQGQGKGIQLGRESQNGMEHGGHSRRSQSKDSRDSRLSMHSVHSMQPSSCKGRAQLHQGALGVLPQAERAVESKQAKQAIDSREAERALESKGQERRGDDSVHGEGDQGEVVPSPQPGKVQQLREQLEQQQQQQHRHSSPLQGASRDAGAAARNSSSKVQQLRQQLQQQLERYPSPARSAPHGHKFDQLSPETKQRQDLFSRVASSISGLSGALIAKRAAHNGSLSAADLLAGGPTRQSARPAQAAAPFQPPHPSPQAFTSGHAARPAAPDRLSPCCQAPQGSRGLQGILAGLQTPKATMGASAPHTRPASCTRAATAPSSSHPLYRAATPTRPGSTRRNADGPNLTCRLVEVTLNDDSARSASAAAAAAAAAVAAAATRPRTPSPLRPPGIIPPPTFPQSTFNNSCPHRASTAYPSSHRPPSPNIWAPRNFPTASSSGRATTTSAFPRPSSAATHTAPLFGMSGSKMHDLPPRNITPPPQRSPSPALRSPHTLTQTEVLPVCPVQPPTQPTQFQHLLHPQQSHYPFSASTQQRPSPPSTSTPPQRSHIHNSTTPTSVTPAAAAAAAQSGVQEKEGLQSKVLNSAAQARVQGSERGAPHQLLQCSVMDTLGLPQPPSSQQTSAATQRSVMATLGLTQPNALETAAAGMPMPSAVFPVPPLHHPAAATGQPQGADTQEFDGCVPSPPLHTRASSPLEPHGKWHHNSSSRDPAGEASKKGILSLQELKAIGSYLYGNPATNISLNPPKHQRPYAGLPLPFTQVSHLPGYQQTQTAKNSLLQPAIGWDASVAPQSHLPYWPHQPYPSNPAFPYYPHLASTLSSEGAGSGALWGSDSSIGSSTAAAKRQQQQQQEADISWQVMEQWRREQAERSAAAIALLLSPDSGLHERLCSPMTQEEAYELSVLQELANSSTVLSPSQRVKLWGGLEALLASKLPPGPLPPGSPRALAQACRRVDAAVDARRHINGVGSSSFQTDLEWLQKLEATIARVHQVVAPNSTLSYAMDLTWQQLRAEQALQAAVIAQAQL